jgi:hypothetical protein
MVDQFDDLVQHFVRSTSVSPLDLSVGGAPSLGPEIQLHGGAYES